MPDTTSSSRRRPGRPSGARSGELRDAILKATRELLAERGMPNVTQRAIAERAGVQPNLIPYHFGSKRGLFREVVREVSAQLSDAVQTAASLPAEPAERLAAVVKATARVFVENPYAPRLLFEQVLFTEDGAIDEFVARFAQPNLAAMQSLLEAGRESGQLRALDPMFFAPQLIGMNAFFFLAQPLFTRLFELDGVDRDLAERFAESSAALLLHGALANPAEGD